MMTKSQDNILVPFPLDDALTDMVTYQEVYESASVDVHHLPKEELSENDGDSYPAEPRLTNRYTL